MEEGFVSLPCILGAIIDRPSWSPAALSELCLAGVEARIAQPEPCRGALLELVAAEERRAKTLLWSAALEGELLPVLLFAKKAVAGALPWRGAAALLRSYHLPPCCHHLATAEGSPAVHATAVGGHCLTALLLP